MPNESEETRYELPIMLPTDTTATTVWVWAGSPAEAKRKAFVQYIAPRLRNLSPDELERCVKLSEGRVSISCVVREPRPVSALIEEVDESNETIEKY